MEEALRAYTRDAAYAGYAEEATGSLVVGRLADFAVIDRSHGLTEDIAQAHVKMTVVGGRVVHETA